MIFSLRHVPYIVFGLCFHSCVSDNSLTRDSFVQAGITLKKDFKLISYKCSGLTDYNIDIVVELDPEDTWKIENFIEKQPGFFSADTVSGELFALRSNEYPYKKGSNHHWHFYRPTEKSFEYFAMDLNTATNIFKLYYLDEE